MIRILIPVLCVLVWASAGFSQSEPESTDDPASGRPADEVVARLKGEPITIGDLEPDARTVEMNRKAWDEATFNGWMEQVHGQKLIAVIFGELLEEYRRSEEIEPTPEEIDQFIEAVAQTKEESRKEFREQREQIKRRLKEEKLPESERQRLEEQLENLESILASDAEQEEFARSHWGDQTEAMQRRSRERIARQMITSWKVNRSLYERYGGRVIFQQAGPEPVDAYRMFLEEHRDAGDFEILDEGLREQFWRYYVKDSMHTFYDEEDGERFMQTPWWEMEAPLSDR